MSNKKEKRSPGTRKYRSNKIPFVFPYKGLDDPDYIRDKKEFFSERSKEFNDIKPKYKLYNGWPAFHNLQQRKNWIDKVTPSRKYKKKPQGGRQDLKGKYSNHHFGRTTSSKGGSTDSKGNKRGIK